MQYITISKCWQSPSGRLQCWSDNVREKAEHQIACALGAQHYKEIYTATMQREKESKAWIMAAVPAMTVKGLFLLCGIPLFPECPQDLWKQWNSHKKQKGMRIHISHTRWRLVRDRSFASLYVVHWSQRCIAWRQAKARPSGPEDQPSTRKTAGM